MNKAAVVFISGLLPLALEVLFARHTSKLFGTSTMIWSFSIFAAVLGSSLGYFAAQYYKKKVTDSVLALLLVASFIYCSLFMVVSPLFILTLKVLPLGVLLFLVPFLALVPSLIPLGWAYVHFSSKIIEESKDITVALAKIAALGALGGGVGVAVATFLPPFLGTYFTWVFVGFIYLVLFLMVFLKPQYAVIGPVTAAIVLFASLEKILEHLINTDVPQKTISEVESFQSHLRLIQNGPILALMTDGYMGSQAAANLEEPQKLLSVECSALAMQPYLQKDVLLLGFGPGVSFKRMKELSPTTEFTGVEIDGRILAFGKDFGVSQEDLDKVHVGDGRLFLNLNPKKYDTIFWNLSQGTSFPEFLMTEEFYRLTSERLNSGGTLMLYFNEPLARQGNDFYVQAFNKTLQSVYSNVSQKRLRRASYLIAASNNPEGPIETELPAECTAGSWETAPKSGRHVRPFTDARNEIEILNYRRLSASWQQFVNSDNLGLQVEKHFE